MRPDDAISGDCLIIDSLCLVFQNKRVVVNTALYQTAGQERRVKVNLVLCQLDRGHGSHGMRDHEAELLGQAVGRDLDHVQAVQLGDVRLNLFDTDGLRQTEDAIEAEGIRRSWKKLDEAGLVLAVFDGSEPLTREDLALARKCAGRQAIALINKEDKPTRFDAEVIAPYFAMVLPVCCQEEGARKLIASAVARLLGTNQIDPHAASLSGQRQLAAATRAREAVAGALDAAAGGFGLDAVSVCVDDALDALCDLTGENASEAVINEVFERFCVGK